MSHTGRNLETVGSDRLYCERFWSYVDWGVTTQVTKAGMWKLLGTYILGYGPPWGHTSGIEVVDTSTGVDTSGVLQTAVWTPVGHPDWVVEIPQLTE